MSKKLKNIVIATVCFVCALTLTLVAFDRQSAANRIPANSVVYNNRLYKITAGLEEVYRPTDYHTHSELSLANGEFYSTQINNVYGSTNLVWRPRGASFWLYAEMYSPGTSGLSGGTFGYAPADIDEDDPSFARQFFFKKARFVLDTNRNGDFDDTEYLDVVNGRIAVSGRSHSYTLSFDLSLENGQRTVGTFSGRFPPV